MTDPLSIAASIVGIIGLALYTTRLLLEDLQQLKDTPKTVKRLVEDMRSIDTALELLHSTEVAAISLATGRDERQASGRHIDLA